MDQATKKAALTNLETIYDEAVDYIDDILHGELYYTKAECSSTYISAANDGSGSGVICEKMDGYTAQGIIDAGIDAGSICIWSGSEASIPSGWYLCNGQNGTPDLRNRFVIAVGTYAITGNDLPSHYHTYIDDYAADSSSAEGVTSHLGTSYDVDSSTNAVSSTAHGHTGSYFTGGSTDIRPKFYALCLIQKGIVI